MSPPSPASRPRGTTRQHPIGRAWLVLAVCIFLGQGARAGVLTSGDLQSRFPPPLLVGEKSTDLPIWPIFKQNGPATDLVGYIFESIDLAPIPGFSGTPPNLLVAMNPDGGFIDVRVISQHEPVFLDGLGPAPLLNFVAQYPGLTLKQNIKIGSRSRASAQSTNVYIDGVAKATASVRIINQTLLAAALKVARARLHYSGARDPDLVAQVRPDVFASMSWDQLLESGLVGHLAIRGADVRSAFRGTVAQNHPLAVEVAPDETFIDLYAAFVEIPTVGRNLLAERSLGDLRARSHGDDHILLLLSRGPYGFLAEDYVRASVPDRLELRQDGLPIEMRDMDLDFEPLGTPRFAMIKAFRIIGAAGLDLGRPMEIRLRVTRSVGVVYPELVARDFSMSLDIPGRYLVPASDDEKGWMAIWKARAAELVVLASALGLLSWCLLRFPPLVTRIPYLRVFRPLFLLFTLVFIGWYAQGQLSIVNLVALLDASRVGRSWAFFLYDPLSTILWVYVLASLLVWGRGTYCGWLCPYGALQELAGLAGRLVRVPVLTMRARWVRRLNRLKYAILAAILLSAFISTSLTDQWVEVEPFKTAITLMFVRSWPFAAYALGLILVGVVVNKFFCRFLCPLGAALAIMGILRRWNWIARRAECGAPCQTCRHRCAYQAIDAVGSVHYDECFQCMDCVAIYRSDELCAPRILAAKGRKPITPVYIKELRGPE